MNQDSFDTSTREDFLHNMAYAFCRWKYLMLVTFVAMVALVFFAAYLIEPTWDVKVKLQAVPSVSPPRDLFADPTRPKSDTRPEMYGEHVIRILEGKEMALAVVRQFNLDERMRLKKEEPSTVRDKFLDATLGALSRTITAVLEWATGEPSSPADWVDDAATDFNDGLFSWVSAEVAQETDVVELSLNGPTPELANQVADFMIEHLRKKLAEISTTAATEAAGAFRKELEKVSLLQAEADRAVSAFVAANNGTVPAALAAQKTGDLTRLQDERNRLLAEKAELDRYQTAVPEATAPPPAASDRISGNVVIQQLQQRLHDSRSRLAILRAEVTDEHPDVIGLRAQIRQTEIELEAGIDSVIRSVHAELQSRSQAVTALEAELTDLQSQVLEHSQLTQSAEAYRQLRQQLEAHVNALRVTADAGVASVNVRVLDSAKVSAVASPDMPSWFITALVALFFAAGCAVMLPPCIEYWRTPIRGPADLVQQGLTPLAVIPDLGRRWAAQNDQTQGHTT
jgi:uncharacterized protein involved in exopolysaccharide biosynthesis